MTDESARTTPEVNTNRCTVLECGERIPTTQIVCDRHQREIEGPLWVQQWSMRWVQVR